MRSNISIVFLVLFFISCQKTSQKITSLNGNWESIGSGWVLQIPDSTQYALYDLTTISCLPAREAALDEIIESITLKNDTLYILKGVMTYAFTKIDALPPICNQKLSAQKKTDLHYNFEVFAETVKDHYAFKELNSINWPKIYKQQKQQLTANSSETDLYSIIEETLEILNDNHAFLEATPEVYDALKQLETNKEEASSQEELPEYGDFQVANMVAEHHMVEDMTNDSWLIKWGKMENNIGFIQVKAMWLYADLNIPETTIKEMGYVDAYVNTFHQMNEGQYIQQEVAGVRKVMDRVMSDLKNTTSIVIDVRFNGGGQDAVNFEILKRFNTKKRQIATAKLKHKKAWSPVLTIYLDAADSAYTNPVYVLTSQQSGSASESFAIGTMSLPHVKRIGAPTQGALSTALEKTLPNGWTFSISNEIYMDMSGNSYENVGVPVDYTLDYPKDRQTFFRSVVDDLDTDKEQILTAIKELTEQ